MLCYCSEKHIKGLPLFAFLIKNVKITIGYRKVKYFSTFTKICEPNSVSEQTGACPVEELKVELLYSCYPKSNIFIIKHDLYTAVGGAEVIELGSSESKDMTGAEVNDLIFVAC